MVMESIDTLAKLQPDLLRIVALMNTITVGGTVNANLEGCPEFMVAEGQGPAFYTAVNGIKATVCTVTAASIADLYKGKV